MSQKMKNENLVKQSKTAYNQWCEQWRDHSIQHASFKHKSLDELANKGIGKAILAVANGYSFEENIEVIKKYKNNVDIIACDKTLGHLLDNGIEPTYVLVCDANVNYELYLEKYKDKLQNTILLINVCANPKWSKNGNWKDIYFFVNKDVIDSHLEFSKLSGCYNFIPAGTNVSNAMIIMLFQCDNEGKRNFFAYDKVLLIGFDYSWKANGKYYAFNDNGSGKDQYMCHAFFNSPTGEFCYSSGNLMFSKNWLTEYINTFSLPVVQCAKDSLLQLKLRGDLAYQMQYRYKTEDAADVRNLIRDHEKLSRKLKETRDKLDMIAKDHFKIVYKSI